MGKNSTRTRLPGDASVADLARSQMLKRDANKIRQLKPEELQQRIRQHMTINPVPDNTDQLNIEREGQIQLKITEIDPYDKNPRQTPNERYEEIKESIRTSRMQSPLVVTKRPASNRYMVAAGGNTRLKAQNELWLETQDPRFEYVLATYRPWESEVKILAAHVAENDLRGEMIFWDKANGIWTIKQEIEQERGQALSLRQLHDALRSYGLTTSITLLSFYGFALDNLSELGEATRLLSRNAVETLQPAFKHLSTYFISAHGRSADDWHALRLTVLRQQAQFYGLHEGVKTEHPEGSEEYQSSRTLDPAKLIATLEQAIAQLLDQTTDQIRDVRRMAKSMPKASMAELVRHYQDTQARKSNPIRSAAQTPSGKDETRQASPPGNEITGSETSDSTMPPAFEQDRQNKEISEENRRALVTAIPNSVETASDVDFITPPASIDPLKEVQTRITFLARLCGFADCLRLADTMPASYFVDVPADDTPIDLDPQHPDCRDRYVGWWLAAMHSGQIGGNFSHRMPINSKWRQAQLAENGSDDTAMPWLIETVLGNPIGLTEMANWLTHPDNRAMVEYQQLLSAIQHLRITHPERFYDGNDEVAAK